LMNGFENASDGTAVEAMIAGWNKLEIVGEEEVVKP
jgi:hypothetical protein